VVLKLLYISWEIWLAVKPGLTHYFQVQGDQQAQGVQHAQGHQQQMTGPSSFLGFLFLIIVSIYM
jgi:lipopolysaccharide/colanic/teichoic acid biosynthesis glycosyltransferase